MPPPTNNMPSSGQEDGYAPLRFNGGVDNRSHETKLGEDHVRHADNVEIDKDGVLSRRAGYSQLAALLNAHSLWSHKVLAFALVADSNKLYRLDPNGALTPLVTDLNGSDVSYELVAQRIRWSNGVQTGQINLLGETSPLGVETPLPSFTVTPIANGGLFGGRHGITMTFASAEREEGGAPDTVFVDVPEGGGILIGAIPTSEDSAATEARVYVTGSNGDQLQYAGSAVPGAATFLVGAGARGRSLTTQFCEPFPAATHLFAKAGRLFGALGRYLIWSEAMYYGLYRPTFNFAPFADDITMIAAPESEQFLVFVGTTQKTYVWQGDSLETAKPSVVSNEGVIPGSMVMVPSEVLRMERVLTPVPVWVGNDGVPYAGTLEGVIPLSEVFAYPIYDQAAAAFVQQDGLSRYIVSGRGGRQSGLAMTDSAIATVINN
ncbi:MAG: hypothetical protein WA777_12690 [Rhodanobacter sp.]